MTTATLTPDNQRMDRITDMFGGIPFDNVVFHIADDITDDYNGGFWNYFEDDNGQFLYMAPADGEFSLSIPGNGFTGTVDADTFGLIVTLIGIGHLLMHLFENNDQANGERINDLFHKVRQFALNHKKASTIAQAID